jgi:hypothetical protein
MSGILQLPPSFPTDLQALNIHMTIKETNLMLSEVPPELIKNVTFEKFVLLMLHVQVNINSFWISNMVIEFLIFLHHSGTRNGELFFVLWM